MINLAIPLAMFDWGFTFSTWVAEPMLQIPPTFTTTEAHDTGMHTTLSELPAYGPSPQSNNKYITPEHGLLFCHTCGQKDTV